MKTCTRCGNTVLSAGEMFAGSFTRCTCAIPQTVTDLRAQLATQAAEIARLTEALENTQAAGIHSCGDNCQRPACVQRREVARLTAENTALLAELERSGLRSYQAAAKHPTNCAPVAPAVSTTARCPFTP